MNKFQNTHYNWSTATKNIFKAIISLYGCIRSNHNAWIIRISNLELAKKPSSFPIMDGNNTMPYRNRKPVEGMVYVVVFSSEPLTKVPLWVKTISTIIYPFRFIPELSVLRMENYTLYKFRVGSVFNGYSIELQIPKKFSFKDKQQVKT